jgi:phospholipid transport system substrate-binding protein
MRVRTLVISFLFLCTLSAAAAQFSTPKARVKDSIDRVIAVLKDESLDRDTKWQRIAAVINEGFDFRSMSQSVLATHWQRATDEERRRFTEFFSQYIEETYRAKIEAYTDEQILYKNESIRGDRAVVETLIVTGSNKIPVNFKLKNNDGEWFAYDVIIEGVSLVANYRSTFAAIVKNEGMSGLLSNIQRRIQKYKERKEREKAEEANPAKS